MKIKLFSDSSENDLTKKVNDFINCAEVHNIIDITYSMTSSNRLALFGVMVTYTENVDTEVADECSICERLNLLNLINAGYKKCPECGRVILEDSE